MDARFPLLQLKHHGVRATGENQTNHTSEKRGRKAGQEERTRECGGEENHLTTR